MFCKKVVLKNSAKFTGKLVYRSFFDKVVNLADFGTGVLLSTWWISLSHLNFISPCKLIFLTRCVHLLKFPSSMFTVSNKFSKFLSNIFNDCNHLVVNPRRRGCLHEKKHSSYSLVKWVSRLAGMILIFIFMRSFVPVCRDVTWYCFEFSSIWF